MLAGTSGPGVNSTLGYQGRSRDQAAEKHGGEREGAGRKPEGYVIESSGQPDYLIEKTIEIVAKDVGVSPKTVQRAAQKVRFIRSIEEKTSPEVIEMIDNRPEDVPTAHLAVKGIETFLVGGDSRILIEGD